LAGRDVDGEPVRAGLLKTGRGAMMDIRRVRRWELIVSEDPVCLSIETPLAMLKQRDLCVGHNRAACIANGPKHAA